MQFDDKALHDILNATTSAVCVEKELIDELRSGPNEVKQMTDREFEVISMYVATDTGSELRSAILFKEL